MADQVQDSLPTSKGRCEHHASGYDQGEEEHYDGRLHDT